MRNPPLILLVDDDAQLIDLFYAKLTTEGFMVKKAYNGKEGFELAKSEKPDLILLDLKMPVMDGTETLKKLHEDPETKDLKVIILSSFNDWSQIKLTPATARALGAIDFIEKGIDLNELTKKIKSLLSS
jgi:two-component system alkaline phosphatase synthesis response regulator PhoP